MKKRLIKTVAMIAMISLPVCALDDGGRSSTPPALMPLSEVKPGQIGIVKTVFQGTRAEEFECEVIGILKNSIGPKKDMIMVKLRGQKPEFTGVAAGMSGSPVFINGRLVGALAFRWGVFSKEPIAGITPIHDILEAGSYEQAPANRPQRAADGEAGSTSTDSFGIENGVVTPIATPLVFAGFDRRLFDQFAGSFRRGSLSPTFLPMMGGGGATTPAAANSTLEPGDAIGVVLMSGDLSVAASGTVTYRDGNRVYGFGHPMFQFGTTDIPMSKAEVLLTLSSSMASSKLTQATEIVGAIKQDRLTAIVGQLGAKARMIPVTVDVHTARGESKTYNFEMFEDPTFTPMLLNLAVANTIVGSSDNELVQTVSLKGRFEMENHAPVEVAQIAMSSDESELFLPVAMRVSGQLTRIFSTLYNNQLERPLIKKIGIQVEQAAERRGTIIEEIRADREEVRPGEEFSLAVILRPYRNERVTRIVTLKAPETAERDQDLRVTVSDAASLDAAESRSGSPSGPATSLRELIARLNRARSASSIYVKLSQNTPGAIVNQQTLPSLPRSVLSVMRSNQTAATTVATSDSTLMITAEPVGYPVSGSKAITLRVR